MKALYPGSFDPLTRGHLDVIERASRLVDQLIVAVGVNVAKTPLVSPEQRMALIEESTTHLPNVTITTMPTTVIDLAQREHVDVVIKGVRDGVDLSAELTQAAVNRDLGGVETLLIPSSAAFAHVSSTVVREMIKWGMDTSRYVPPAVERFITDNRSNLCICPGGSHV